MAAAVVGDAPVAVRRQEEHLRLPGVGGQRPAVAEDDGLSAAPVLVVDLRAVLGLDRVHGTSSCFGHGLTGRGLGRRKGQQIRQAGAALGPRGAGERDDADEGRPRETTDQTGICSSQGQSPCRVGRCIPPRGIAAQPEGRYLDFRVCVVEKTLTRGVASVNIGRAHRTRSDHESGCGRAPLRDASSRADPARSRKEPNLTQSGTMATTNPCPLRVRPGPSCGPRSRTTNSVVAWRGSWHARGRPGSHLRPVQGRAPQPACRGHGHP